VFVPHRKKGEALPPKEAPLNTEREFGMKLSIGTQRGDGWLPHD